MADIKIRQYKCSECSATLTLPPEGSSVRCTYCGTTLTIERKRPPRDPAMTQPRTVYVAPPVPAVVRAAPFLGLLIPFVVLGVNFGPELLGHVKAASGKLPVECPTNGHITVDGKTFTGTGTLIRAGVNCKVLIKDSTLSADTIVEGEVNLELEIQHSTLTAKRAAIVSGVNTKLRIGGQSQVRGEKLGLDLGPNAVVKLEDGKLSSAGTALRASSNLSLDAAGEISGATAVDASGWTQRYEVDDAKITGAQKVKRSR